MSVNIEKLAEEFSQTDWVCPHCGSDEVSYSRSGLAACMGCATLFSLLVLYKIHVENHEQ